MSETKSFLNRNGLVNGIILAGTPCPFEEECVILNDRCPQKNDLKEYPYSCAAARAFSMSKIE